MEANSSVDYFNYGSLQIHFVLKVSSSHIEKKQMSRKKMLHEVASIQEALRCNHSPFIITM